jgi:hypothetical protein
MLDASQQRASRDGLEAGEKETEYGCGGERSFLSHSVCHRGIQNQQPDSFCCCPTVSVNVNYVLKALTHIGEAAVKRKKPRVNGSIFDTFPDSQSPRYLNTSNPDAGLHEKTILNRDSNPEPLTHPIELFSSAIIPYCASFLFDCHIILDTRLLCLFLLRWIYTFLNGNC